jgi:hypothetical protein
MLFAIADFEHFFSPTQLRRGIAFFESGKVELEERDHDSRYVFKVINHSVAVQKKGSRVKSFICTCGAKYACAHFCAAMFFFFPKSPKRDLFLKKESGVAIFSRSGGGNPEGVLLFESAVKELKRIFSDAGKQNVPYLVDERLYSFILRKKVGSRQVRLLAAYACQPPSYSVVKSAEEQKKKRQIESELESWRRSNRSVVLKEAWHAATLFSLRNDAQARSCAFSFLLPRDLLMINAPWKLGELEEIVVKRKFKPAFPLYINALLIAKLQLHIVRNEVITGLPGAELPMAHAELDLLSGKRKQSLKILKDFLPKIKYDFSEQFSGYLDFAIEKSKELKDRDGELLFFAEKLRSSLYIREEDLTRIHALCSGKDAASFIKAVISGLKKDISPATFEKLIVLNMDLGEIAEAMKLFEHEGDRLALVQRYFSQLRQHDEKRALQLYVKHLTQTLERTRYPEIQSMIIKSAMNCDDTMNKVDALFLKEYLQSVFRNDRRYNRLLNEFSSAMARAI